MEEHQPQLLTRELIAEHDMVLVMDVAQLRYLQARFPEFHSRFFLLPLFERTDRRDYGRWNIADPFGRSLADFETCYERICESLRGLFDVLEFVPSDRVQRDGRPDHWRRTALVVGALFALIVVVSATLGGRLEPLLLRAPGADKPLHVFGFAVLFVLCYRLLKPVSPYPLARVAGAVSIGALLGVADELLQGFERARNVEVADFAADLCGLALGASLVLPRPWLRGALLVVSIFGGSLLTFDSYTNTRDYLRGVRAESRRDYVAARQHYLKAFESGMRTPGLYNGLGWVEIESGQGSPSNAVAYAGTAVSMRPDDPDFLDTYGWALLHAGQSAEALEYLLRAYAKKPTMYCIHYHLGEAYRRLDRRDEARQHFNQQLVRTPQGPDAAMARQALSEMLTEDTR